MREGKKNWIKKNENLNKLAVFQVLNSYVHGRGKKRKKSCVLSLAVRWIPSRASEEKSKENKLVNAIDFVRTSLDASLDIVLFVSSSDCGAQKKSTEYNLNTCSCKK